MFSGGDSSGDGVNSRNQFNWQMTSQTSCNINSGGSIDWASLAQQWIQMKDSGAGLPDTPPPPVITNTKPIKLTKFDEQGEADMEVEKDDELQVLSFSRHTPTPPPPPTNNLSSAHWFTPQQEAAAFLQSATQQNQWNPWPPRVALPPPTLHVPITTGSLTPPVCSGTSTTPPLQNISKNPIEAASMLPSKESLEPPPMDAAKRKILPAWIREGLEKMEREKLRQLERDQKDKDPQAAAAAADTTESDIKIKFKTMVKSSTTEMEGESSGNDEANESDAPDAVATYTDIDTNAETIAVTTTASVQQQERTINSGKTYEERISDMMIAVRKTLTELLLEVTNEEISSVAHEAIRKRRAKASSAQVIRKSAIPSITGKLGLEAYADSDSDNSASDDDDDTTNDDSRRSDDENDSEEELKANIRICKRAFAKTIEDIEDRIQASAAREELLLKEHQKRDTNKHQPDHTDIVSSPVHKTKGFDTEIGEPQPDKKSNSNGKRRKERTSRFSDNKDSRNRLTTGYYQQPTSMGSGNLPSQVMPGAAIPPPSNFAASKYKPTNSAAAAIATSANEKRPSANKSSKQSHAASSSRRHRHSDSSSSSSETSSSGTRSSHSRRSKQSSSTHHKRSSRERSKRSHRSSSHRSSRRRDSSDSNDDDHYKKRSSRHRSHKSGSSSTYSRRHDRRRSDSRSTRSRTRSRSRSRSTTYSSSRRGDRY